MKKNLFTLSLALMLCPVAAISAPEPKKAPVKKTAPAKKTTSKKTKAPRKTPAKAPAKSVAKTEETTTTPSVIPVPGPAGEYPVIVGDLRCDEGTATLVSAANNAFHIRLPKRSYTMERVPTTTGVVRLEDKISGAYWLQMGNKSMLIDPKAGGRVADGCRNDEQQAREEQLKKAPVNLLH